MTEKEKRKKADRENLNDENLDELKVAFHNNYETDKCTVWLLSLFNIY